MGNRRAFRPIGNETLEERVVLSHASPNISNTPMAFGPVGTLGDSYTDEYQFYPPDRTFARNWVEILHATRVVTFGPFSLKSRGEPRDQGYAYNWAKSDATSVDMIQNQLPGLTQQVANGQIRYVSIFIGGNDFLHLLDGVESGLIPPADALPALQQTTAVLEANFATAVKTVLAANPHVFVVAFNLPDVSLLPIARALATTPQAQLLLQATSQAIKQYNASIAAVVATSPRVAEVDLAGITAKLASNPSGTASFGGQTISLTTAGNDYHDFFLADGIHIGTIGQGIIADEFALTVDSHFGGQLFPPTPQEIVHYAQVVQRHAQRSHGKG
jgi:hypothetical protein